MLLRGDVGDHTRLRRHRVRAIDDAGIDASRFNGGKDRAHAIADVFSAGALLGAVRKNILDQTFMRGLSDFLDAVYSPERFFQKWAAGVAGGFGFEAPDEARALSRCMVVAGCSRARRGGRGDVRRCWGRRRRNDRMDGNSSGAS